jgi:hypothetical protein
MTRTPWTLKALLAVLFLSTLSVGCQSTSAQKKVAPLSKEQPLPAPPPPSWETSHSALYPPAPPPGNPKLVQRMELAYYIVSDQQKQVPIMAGQSQVGPDGTIVIGPYGQFYVTGLTLSQASQVIEQGVRKYTPNDPLVRVQLQLLSPAQTLGTTWSSGGPASSGVTPVNGSAPDWTSSGGPPALPPAGYAGPTWGAPVAQIPPPTTSTTPAPATPQNKRGPVLTYIFGPRY